MNQFSPTRFLPETLSRRLDFCLQTLMNFNVLEFEADFRNPIFLCVEYNVQISFHIYFMFHACSHSTFRVIFTRRSLHFHILGENGSQS